MEHRASLHLLLSNIGNYLLKPIFSYSSRKQLEPSQSHINILERKTRLTSLYQEILRLSTSLKCPQLTILKVFNFLPCAKYRSAVKGDLTAVSRSQARDLHGTKRCHHMDSLRQGFASICRFDGNPYTMTSCEMLGKFACDMPIFRIICRMA